MRKIILILLTLCLLSMQLISAETIELQYAGDIDKPLSVLVFKRGYLEYDMEVHYSTFTDFDNRQGFEKRVECVLPDNVYDLVFEQILIASEIDIKRKNMRVLCIITDNGIDQLNGFDRAMFYIDKGADMTELAYDSHGNPAYIRIYRLNIEECISALVNAMKIITHNEINHEIEKYTEELKALLSRYG